MKLDNIAKEQWCRFCSNKELCTDKECQLCLNKSFANNEKAKYWDYNKNVKIPRQVFKSTATKYWFICEKCNHSINMQLSTITKGQWCKFCSTRSTYLCNDKDCKKCESKSFASSLMVKYWNYNKNSKTPREVFLNTHEKYWFICENNHSFNASLAHITNGKWCPWCKKKTETKLKKFLDELYDNVIHQFRQPELFIKLDGKLSKISYDFLLSNIIIELDGRQHFEQVKNWDSPIHNHNNDINKISKALDNGYNIIRLSQYDVLKDLNDWKEQLIWCINDALHSSHVTLYTITTFKLDKDKKNRPHHIYSKLIDAFKDKPYNITICY